MNTQVPPRFLHFSSIPLAIILSIFSTTSFAVTNTWADGAGVDWYANAANWSLGHFPLPTEDVLINTVASPVLNSAPVSINSLTTSGASVFTVTGQSLSATNTPGSSISVFGNSTLNLNSGSTVTTYSIGVSANAVGLNINNSTVNIGGPGIADTGTSIIQFDNATIVNSLGPSFSNIQGPHLIINAGGLTINPGGAFILTSPMTGVGAFNVNAQVELLADFTYSGGTNVGATGQLILGGGGTTGSVVGDIVNNGNVTFNHSNAMTYGGVISGSGTMTKLGTNTLTLTNVNTYTGLTTINNGILIVGDALHPGATISGNLNVDPNGTLEGHGTIIGDVTSAGTVSPGTSSIGTITINGNYTTSPSGVFIAEVDGNGNSDLLDVGGVATLDGTIFVLEANNGFLKNHLYTIITAGGGVVGQFANQNFDSVFTQGFLRGELIYSPNMVQFIVDLNKAAIEQAVQTPNQKAVADYILDVGSTTAVNGLLASITTDAQLQAALDQISGATYTNQSLMLARTGNWFSNELSDRFDAFPSCNPCCRYPSRGDRCSKTCDERGQLWIAGHGSHDEMSAGQVSGFNMDNSNAALGYERSLNPCAKVGIGAAYNHFSGDATVREMGQMSGDLYQVGLYGRYRTGNWMLGAAVDAGKTNDVQVSRQINGAMGVVSTAGSYKADFYTEQARLSYDLTMRRPFRVSPFVGVINQQLNRDSFTENTNTGFELSVDSSSYNSTRSQLGMLLELPMGSCVKSFASADWEHEFADDQATFNAGLVGVSGGQFHIQSDTIGRDAALVKAGVVLLGGSNWNIAASYEGWFNNKCQQNGGTLQLNLVIG